jgi:uncharacterized protein (TIGR02270 family)
MSAASPLLRPIGFRPWEISSMINQEVIDQYAEETAFLWTQRDHATIAPQYALKDLAKLDGRVEAHVDGLRVAKDAGWATALKQLDQGPGEVFAVSVLAFENGDSTRIDPVLEVGCSSPVLARALVSSLGWIQQGQAVIQAQKLAQSKEPEVSRAGIAGLAVHRVDPGSLLATAISGTNPRLSARAMQAAAELGRRDLTMEILIRLSDADESCRFWAAWSAVRLGERYSNSALEVLRATATAGGRLAEQASDMLLRVLPVDDGHQFRHDLAAQPPTARLAVIGAGVIGDPAAVSELIAHMENPELARAAGGAFSMITGADLGYEDLDGDAPLEVSADDDDAEADLDSDYPWPKPAAVRIWWVKRAADYSQGVRYLRGKPITDGSLVEVLTVGRQNQRSAAALELALRHPAEILFETRERAQWQQKKVGQWSS